MVKAMAFHSTGREFDARPFRSEIATLGKLFTHACLCRRL